MLGAFLAFYAFIGFEDMVNVAEEVKEPRRILPLAILITIGISTLLYLLVALVAVLALPPAELAQSRAPLALLYERATGSAPTLISLISMFAVVNGALIQIIMASRVLYGMSREGWLHGAFGQGAPVHADAAAGHGGGHVDRAGAGAVAAAGDAGEGDELHHPGRVRPDQPVAGAHQAQAPAPGRDQDLSGMDSARRFPFGDGFRAVSALSVGRNLTKWKPF